jgi:hypothetical protein
MALTGLRHTSEGQAPDAAERWQELVERFDLPEVRALVLMGSYARGDAGPFSDIDLVRFTAAPSARGSSLPGTGSHLVDGWLVVVSDIDPEEVETYFVRPELAVSRIHGLRQGRPLRDPDGCFAGLQRRANAFVWDDAMQARANAFASDKMVGWIEEVHKGLTGLQRGDTGRLLDAEFGLSWGLNHLVAVQRGVLHAGGDWFAQVERAVGPETEWVRLRRQAFGVTPDEPRDSANSHPPPPTLRARVIAGLRLYAVTAELLTDEWTPEAAPLISETARLVLERQETIVAQLRERFGVVPETVSLADELIQERREEA